MRARSRKVHNVKETPKGGFFLKLLDTGQQEVHLDAIKSVDDAPCPLERLRAARLFRDTVGSSITVFRICTAFLIGRVACILPEAAIDIMSLWEDLLQGSPRITEFL